MIIRIAHSINDALNHSDSEGEIFSDRDEFLEQFREIHIGEWRGHTEDDDVEKFLQRGVIK